MAGGSDSGMRPERILRASAGILLIKEVDPGLLAVVDAEYALRFVDPASYRLFGGCRLPAPENRSVAAVDIVSRGHLCLIADEETGTARLFSIKKQRTLCELGAHRGAVLSLAFDPAGRYAVTAGADGKVAAWELKTGRRAFNAPAHTDGVLTVAFDAAGHAMATGGYDRTVQLSHPASSKGAMMLYGHSKAVTALCFIGKERLVSGDTGGNILLWDVSGGSLAGRLEHLSGAVKALCSDAEGRLLFAATDRGAIALYDLRSMACLDASWAGVGSEVCSMILSRDGRLIAGCGNGEIHVFAPFRGAKAMSEALERGDYARMEALTLQNPALRYSEAFASLESAWEAALTEFAELLKLDRAAEAAARLEPFRCLESKRKEFREIDEALEAYERFRVQVEERRFSLAYALASKHPRLRETLPYRNMETEWERRYERAKRLLGDRRTESEGAAQLADFRGISEKAREIRELLDERKRYVMLKDLIGKQEWRKACDLVRHHPVLQETDAYTSLINIADRLFISAQKAYEAGDFRYAATACKALLDFPDFREDATALLQRIEAPE